jgi:hypothetical protein
LHNDLRSRYFFTVIGPFIKAMGRPVLRLVRKEAERTTETPPS